MGAVDLCWWAVAHSFNGWALSYIESLDTLWLMGLYEEFDDALAVVANTTFSLPPVSWTPFHVTRSTPFVPAFLTWIRPCQGSRRAVL
jgi:hypothetical protein